MGVMETEKKEHPNKIFYRRMRREGRYEAYNKRVKEIMKETEAAGERAFYSHASRQARKEFGYAGPKGERQLEAQYLEQLEKNRLMEKLKAEREEIREERRVENFESALRELPDSASSAVEIAWIRAHPAMSRKSRGKASVEPVLISAEDVLSPPHGRAPSKAAVHALQYWANHPQKFFEKILDAQRKKDSDEEASEAEADEDLAEVERLLAAVSAGA